MLFRTGESQGHKDGTSTRDIHFNLLCDRVACEAICPLRTTSTSQGITTLLAQIQDQLHYGWLAPTFNLSKHITVTLEMQHCEHLANAWGPVIFYADFKWVSSRFNVILIFLNMISWFPRFLYSPWNLECRPTLRGFSRLGAIEICSARGDTRRESERHFQE